jgi:hypothetical protein
MKAKLLEVDIISNKNHDTIGNAYFKRLTSWKNVKNLCVTKRHPLFESATDENGYPCNDENFNKEQKYYYLDCVEFKGYKIPLSSCANLFNNFYFTEVYRYVENGETHYIGSCDLDNYYNPLYFEFDEYGESYRVYEKIKYEIRY